MMEVIRDQEAAQAMLTDTKPECTRQDSPTNREMPWRIIRFTSPHAQLERCHQRTSTTFAIEFLFIDGRCCPREKNGRTSKSPCIKGKKRNALRTRRPACDMIQRASVVQRVDPRKGSEGHV